MRMSTMHSALRYTLRGSSRVERHIGMVVARAAGLVAKHFNHNECRAFVLLGGYGRGEGGVVCENGEERPHNNLDFLLITTALGALYKTSLKRRLDDVLAPIVREEGIGIDTGVISDIELRHSPPRVIWIDLRWGHRTILGDASFIPSLRPIAASAVEVDDVHNLLVNRASLLVINDAVLERGITSKQNAEFILKHMMKAIIGHGDALLFARGRYHASYAEKQRRMRELSANAPGLAQLYDEAAEFRFEPQYARHLEHDLQPFVGRVRSVLPQAHLAFERFRSGDPHCTFRNHAERILFAEARSAASFIAASKQLVRSWMTYPRRMGLPSPIEAVVRRSHPRKLLAAVLPTVLYGPTDDNDARLAQSLLRAKGESSSDLRNAYLMHWARYGDPNFHTTAKRLGLSLEMARQSS